MKVGDQGVERAEDVSRPDEELGLARKGCRVPPAAAVSKVRAEVVPTATIRPP